MMYKDIVTKYLSAKSNVWSPSTFKSEAARLRACSRIVNINDPDATLRGLRAADYAPYTIKTTFTRLNGMLGWALKRGLIESNPFDDWLKENAYIFRNVYKSKELSITFEGAKSKIEGFKNEYVRSTALYLLHSGLRLSELSKVYASSEDRYYVDGKGGKRRRVFAGKPPETLPKVHELRAALKSIGLTPHDLRRLFATRLLRKQVPIHDVAKATGHDSIQTLMRYLQSENEDILNAVIRESL